VLATAGDSLVLEHILVTGPGRAPAFEVEALRLIEVDGEGRLLAATIFDPDDRRAASAEMLERYARSEAARCVPAVVFEAIRAWNAHDLDRLRAALPADFALIDHRRTGVGRLDSAEAHLAFVATLFELAPDVTFEFLYVVAAEARRLLAMAHAFGTLAGGGDFEQVYAFLSRGNEACGRLELFEPDDLDRARARFEELRQE